MSSFPLFRLPFVPIGEILELFSPIELIELSCTSKKAAKKVKLGGSKDFNLSLNFDENYVEITTKNEPFCPDKLSCERHTENQNIMGSRYFNGHHVQIGRCVEGFMLTLWDDPAAGVETLGFHLADLFGCPIDNLETGSLPTETFIRVHQSILQRQQNLNCLDIRNMALDEKQLVEVLTELKITESLVMDLELSSEFPVALFRDTKIIELTESSWFSAEMLLETNCKDLNLFESLLTNRDVDAYLKRWKRGEFPNIKHIHIESRYNFDNRTPILEFTPPIWNRKHKFPKRFGSRYSDRTCNGVGITSDSGEYGTIQLNGDEFDFTVWD